jgi:hypothetical protein
VTASVVTVPVVTAGARSASLMSLEPKGDL